MLRLEYLLTLTLGQTSFVLVLCRFTCYQKLDHMLCGGFGV